MRKEKFTYECGNRTIDPVIALENEKIVQALKDRDDERVLSLLDSEF